MKKLSAAIFLVMCTFGYAQIGINTVNPHPSTALDIQSDNKGVLIPQVALKSRADVMTVEEPANGLLVYNTSSVSGLTPGFYYFDQNRWRPIIADAQDGSWQLNGNTITDTAYVGTNNDAPLALGANATRIALFYPGGGIALGSNADAEKSSGIAFGSGAYANGLNNIAIGTGSNAALSNTIAIGTYAKSNSEHGVAVGTESAVDGFNTVAVGHLAKALAVGATTFGAGSQALGESSVAVGAYAEATAKKSFALGPNTLASAENSFALGVETRAVNPNTIIIGRVKVPGDTVDITPALVGIGTLEPKARLDVSDSFKLGKHGTVHKGIHSFAHKFTTDVRIAEGESVIISIDVPSDIILQEGNFVATVLATPDPFFPDALNIEWVKLDKADNKKVRVKVKNTSETKVSDAYLSLNDLHLYFTINEF